MRRIALIATTLVAAAATFVAAAGADDAQTYEIEMYNAFGLVEGSDVRVAGVNAGTVTSLDITPDKTALATVELSGPLAVLGDSTKCSSEPQSLIAEYFIDCKPNGAPLEEDDDSEPDIPASRVSQTVQTDLVQNTLREPFKLRFQLLINEFGTALAGNPEELNEAIRLGAPALRDLERVLRILGDQNETIRDLNVDSDLIIGKLEDNKEDIVRFIQNAERTAAASAERRDDLSRNFEIFDDFLAELQPTLADLEVLAREQTPLLTDLRAAAPGLNRLALNLPPFNSASEVSLESLGDAGQVGRKALRRGEDEIDQLGDMAQNAPAAGEALADFLRDLDDPGRAVEEDVRVIEDTGDEDRVGYDGLEGLLNYVYYQTGALNQFDKIGHLLHFSLFTVEAAGQEGNSLECGETFTGRDHESGEPVVPTKSGGEVHVDHVDGELIKYPELHGCVSWMGPNQPGLNEDIGLPKYDSSVCPYGTEPHAAEEELCSPPPAGSSAAKADDGPQAGSRQPKVGADGAVGDPGNLLPDPAPDLPDAGGGVPDLDEALDPDRARERLRDLPRRLRDRLRGRLDGASGGGGGGGGGQATQDLLDFLLKP